MQAIKQRLVRVHIEGKFCFLSPVIELDLESAFHLVWTFFLKNEAEVSMNFEF